MIIAEVANLTEAEVEAAEACQTAWEWNDLCGKVKLARGGKYPPDWWTIMMLSGRMARIFKRWGGDPSIKIGAPR